ncbi:glycosyltransferase family 2 protein [Marinobacter mobilis]|uniref:Glycosyltransferase, catalytic subunit of cellulose synthase and poly-beta-1,6-N-acetylglucosamine synthase n=1 Tax=Marinobacter mobilis TaxID=488533 RepID=A0A1H2UUJ9_9GAMM|nr:glycosyltransferase family 2 protein [Marinobacter mobilis]SDW59807.1 Glycosyltransferase, catalytic subunit of cellulose synthase and poly-beta-1,6-N-acetylglucosamine synthase [Marinobacter mobilis]
MLMALFWLSLFALIYIYIGYPILVRFLAGYLQSPIKQDDSFEPSVSILIAAFNEAKDIRATLENKLALDYPADKFEILVVSDESDDGTDDIVLELASNASVAIKLHRQVPRQGKTAGLNQLVPMASGNIILFSDANSEWEPQALRRLVRNFADPQVGYVTGKMIYVNEDGSLVGDGCSAYMKYENWLREQETRVGSVVGVDGGIDAMRTSLYQTLRADQLPDFVQPLKVVEQGYRVVYEPEALLREHALADGTSEFSMRVRVSLRALWALKDMAHLMNPGKYGFFGFQLVSHKLLRYLAFIPLLLLTLSALFLAGKGGFFALSAIGLVMFYGLSWAGRMSDQSGRDMPVFYSIPYYFMLLNMASLKAALAFLRGEKKVTWTPRKG